MNKWRTSVEWAGIAAGGCIVQPWVWIALGVPGMLAVGVVYASAMATLKLTEKKDENL